MKIPNFLHLTPPVISKQCEALKKFCTPWPAGLETEEKQEKHFPIRLITSDYVHGNPTIRNHLARIVTIKFKLSELDFNERQKDKFLRLVEERYDPKTDEVTITTDRCPIRQQNYDYAIYLITALYHESKTIEDWESWKVEADMEKYIWSNNKSKVSATEILNWNNSGEKVEPPKEYGESVELIMNEGENDYNLNIYKENVAKMLGLKAQ
jgi:small subunit ribosomal protein S35